MIRKANNNDASRIHELLKQIALLHTQLYPEYFGKMISKYNVNDVIELINNDGRLVFVYEHDDVVYGYVMGWFNDNGIFFVDDLCVDEAMRGHQIGQKLMNHLEKIDAIHEIQLNVWLANEGAVAFYERLGYEPFKYVMRKRMRGS